MNRPPFRLVTRHSLFRGALMLSAVAPCIAQTGGGSGGELQQKLAAVKQSVGRKSAEATSVSVDGNDPAHPQR
jgi:hypothetical protein